MNLNVRLNLIARGLIHRPHSSAFRRLIPFADDETSFEYSLNLLADRGPNVSFRRLSDGYFWAGAAICTAVIFPPRGAHETGLYACGKVRTSDLSSTVEASAVHFNVFARRCDLCDRRDRIKDRAERGAAKCCAKWRSARAPQRTGRSERVPCGALGELKVAEIGSKSQTEP
jgi:hypothetical protein